MASLNHEYLESKKKKPLTRKLLVYILFFSAVFTILTTAFQLYLDYKRDVGQIDKQIKLIENSYIQPLAEHIWNVDKSQAEIDLTSIINLPDIQYVELVDSTTEISIYLGEKTDLNSLTHRFRLERVISKAETVPLGYLSINTSLDNVHSRLRDRVLTILVTQAIKAFFVSLFIFLITYHLITRHLSTISKHAIAINLNTLGHPLELKRKPSRASSPDELDQVVSSLNDMHARILCEISAGKKTEEELSESEERFHLLVENAPDAVFVRDKDSFVYLNNAALTLFGANSTEDLIGTPVIERYHLKFRDTIRERMRIINDLHMPAPLLQSICLQLDGTEVAVESSAVAMNFQGKNGALVFMRNVTARVDEDNRRQHLEEQLHQSQKIESLGRLAGGVAHDYNNMLSVIIGNTELAQMKAKRAVPLDDNLEHILQAANRSRDITRQLLAFARKQVINPKALDLNAAVKSMLTMLRNLLGENIDLRWQPKERLWQVKIDPSQLDQVLANLCINARDAITDAGKMTIETDTVNLGEDYCKDRSGFLSGDYVVLSVTDNGCGMDKETLDNVFEPFFTTKQTGEGTGLGMATVYGIVKQSGGFIDVYSEPSQGTTFKIYFPRHEGKDVVSQVTTVSEIQKGQGETVLLVEDEIAIVELATAMLEDLGYRVLPANSPVEALNLLKEFQGAVHLLLTDVIMPGMNGRELAQQVREIHPKTKALYMSGYTANVIAPHGVLDEGINFIQKPFSRSELSIRVREILDAHA